MAHMQSPDGAPNPHLAKGRGAAGNQQSRFIRLRSEAEPDGWASEHPRTGEVQRTQLFWDNTKKLITRNRSPDIPFDQSINPYKGCEHGCIYCFARPTHAYLDLSPGLDFETRIFRKRDPRQHLLRELAAPSYQCSVLAMGTNTDPYQPLEKSQRVTREVLQTLLELRHPVSIVTKSKLILRDLDLLSELASFGLVNVNISLTTLDNGLKAKLEPRTAGPAARLRTLAELRAAGVPTGALVAPIIPFINDHEIEAIVAAAAAAGAMAAGYILVRLPLEVAPLFQQWLQDHYPGKAKRVMAAIRNTRGGRDYQARWHQRMVGQGEIAGLIRARFNTACKKHGLHDRRLPDLRCDLFVAPPRVRNKSSADESQLSLF